jgi:hypothetical protein
MYLFENTPKMINPRESLEIIYDKFTREGEGFRPLWEALTNRMPFVEMITESFDYRLTMDILESLRAFDADHPGDRRLSLKLAIDSARRIFASDDVSKPTKEKDAYPPFETRSGYFLGRCRMTAPHFGVASRSSVSSETDVVGWFYEVILYLGIALGRRFHLTTDAAWAAESRVISTGRSEGLVYDDAGRPVMVVEIKPNESSEQVAVSQVTGRAEEAVLANSAEVLPFVMTIAVTAGAIVVGLVHRDVKEPKSGKPCYIELGKAEESNLVRIRPAAYPLLIGAIRLVELLEEWTTVPEVEVLVPHFVNKKLNAEGDRRLVVASGGMLKKKTKAPTCEQYEIFINSIKRDGGAPAHRELPHYTKFEIDEKGLVNLEMLVHGRMRMPKLDELAVAVHDILVAVRILHLAKIAHGDIRWHNVVSFEDGSTRGWTLIDLENASDVDAGQALGDYRQVPALILHYVRDWGDDFPKRAQLSRVAIELAFAPLVYLESVVFGEVFAQLVA